ncbi:MAG TPA: carbon-nitrogen hydrolase family protein, partial [Acidobacteriota bacterium]|nr:carbon-nitrogen hydrolase family protein [Acidobacteriota bacterium]
MIQIATAFVIGLTTTAVLLADNSPAHNLVPNAQFEVDSAGAPIGWKAWAPRAELAPESRVVRSGTGNALFLGARGPASYGKWIAVAPGIVGERTYRFEASYQATGVEHEEVSVAAILSWCEDAAGKKAIQRDYAEQVPGNGEWRGMARTIKAPKDAKSVRVELVLRWSGGGSVLWTNVRVAEVDPPAPRVVRVVTTRIAIPQPTSLDTNFKLMSQMLDKAGAYQPDIVLLSENVIDRGVGLPFEKTAQTIPGPLTRMLSEKARRYRMYVVTTLHEKADGNIYNTAVLIGRQGEIVGKYRKVHLALAEGEGGVTPGLEYPVFETDVGKLGILICWDYWFPEPARLLRLKGAEILLLPLAGDGARVHWEVTSRARAIDNGVYLVTSTTVGESTSAIIAPTGEILAETRDDFGVAVSDIDLNREHRLWWLSVGPAEGEAKSLYIKERHPHTYGGLVGAARSLSLRDSAPTSG